MSCWVMELTIPRPFAAADAGIAVSEGAEIAREIADITIGADNLEGISSSEAYQ